MYDKVAYKVNEISILENAINDLGKELDIIIHNKTEWLVKEKKVQVEIQLKKEQLDQEYIKLRGLFISENKK
jgi:uncharacterized protein YoxC